MNLEELRAKLVVGEWILWLTWDEDGVRSIKCGQVQEEWVGHETGQPLCIAVGGGRVGHFHLSYKNRKGPRAWCRPGDPELAKLAKVGDVVQMSEGVAVKSWRECTITQLALERPYLAGAWFAIKPVIGVGKYYARHLSDLSESYNYWVWLAEAECLEKRAETSSEAPLVVVVSTDGKSCSVVDTAKKEATLPPMARRYCDAFACTNYTNGGVKLAPGWTLAGAEEKLYCPRCLADPFTTAVTENKPMKFTPYGDNIIVRLVGEDEAAYAYNNFSGVADEELRVGVVVGVGPGSFRGSPCRVPPDLKIGQHILFDLALSNDFTFNGETRYNTDCDDIIGMFAEE